MDNLELQTQIVEKEQNIFNNTDKPDYGESRTELYLSEGIKNFENGDVEKAHDAFLKILEIDANNIDANFNLGVLHRDKRNYQKALKFFTKCNENLPNNFTVIFNIAYSHEMLKQFRLAINYYEEATKISGDNYELFFNLGNIYKNLKDWENAKINYAKSLSIKPDNILALNNYASAFFFTGFFDEAIKLYNKVLELDPDNFDAKLNYAAACVELQKFDEALKLYQSLLKVKPNDAELHYNFAILLLLLGNKYKGLQEYEWRLKNKLKYSAYPEIPFWDNQNLKGKTIVVIDEQGIGDAFQFVRYLQLLREDGAEVIFSCREALIDFMNEAKVADKVVSFSAYVKADYKIYLMSLPLKDFEKTNSLNFDFPYFKFNQNLLGNKSIAVDKQKLNIGIVWRGNPEHMYDFKRSIRIEDFTSLFDNNYTKLFSLQKDVLPKEREVLLSKDIVDLSSKENNFIETAKIINQLDLIISVDTAVAHLAGAMNKNTFLLLPKVPDWRWGLGTNRTQNYPSVKLFRQNKLLDWTNVIAEIREAINKIILKKIDKEQVEPLNIIKLKFKALEAIENKNYAQAIEKLKTFLLKKQNDDEALFWLGFCYFELKNYVKAEQILLKAEKVNNHNFETLSLLGKLSLRKNGFVQAENYYKKALSIKEDIDTLNGLGVSLQKQGKFGESLDYFRKTILLNEHIAGNHLNYANSCYYLQNFEEAIKHFNIAIKLNDLPSAHIGKSFALLSQKKFRDGFIEYEWSISNFQIPPNSKAKKWNGELGIGKKIFIYADQGLGDTIQFSRFLKDVKEKGFYIYLLCPKPLRELFEHNPFVDEVSEQFATDTDYYMSIMNLPKVLSMKEEKDFSLPENLFNVDGKTETKWKLSLNAEKYNVGLVWESKSKLETIESKSVSLNIIDPLLEVENVNFYVLQKDYDKETTEILDKYSNVKLINEDLFNMAALIKNLDLVITIDSAVAHLASSLGKETWIMLPFISDWRWEFAGNKSYWYPSVTLFRQNKFNDWSSVIENVKKSLYEKVNILRSQKKKVGDKITGIKKLLDEHKLESAKKELLNIVNQKPQSVEVNFYLGYIFQLENKLEIAASYYSKVLSVNPGHFDALNNLGVVLKDLGRFEESEEFLNYASMINKENPSVYNNLGIVHDLMGYFSQALTDFKKSIEINSNYQEALLNYANTLQTVKKYPEAISILEKLLSLNPNHIGGNFNKALTLLAMEEYRKGFELYEWRRKRKDFFIRKFNKPELTSQNVNGKTILVYDEQGLGDTIQFCRYVKLLADKNAKVILQCHSALSELLKGCDGVNKVLARESLEDIDSYYDYHIPLLSLPKYFGTELLTVPQNVPYINVPENLVKEFEQKYFDNHYINVGIVWEGKTPVGNAHRACSVDNFSNLVKNKSLKFFSLQKGEVAERDKQKMDYYGITDLSGELKTFKETAAIIKNLDLVITIDTSVAHLAGALGTKTYLLLSYKHDWRWAHYGEYSVWYPTIKMIKQTEFGNWENSFEKLKILLNENETDFEINHNQ